MEKMADMKQSTNTFNAREDKPDMPYYKVLQRYIPILVVNVLFIFVMAYFISPWSKVGTISVQGNEAVYDQTIIDKSTIQGGDSVIDTLNISDDLAEKITAELPQVEKTTVSLDSLNHIVIEVEEFDTVAYIANEGSYLRVLENGAVLDDMYSVSLGNQPVLSNFEEGKALDLMIEELSQLDEPILNLISEIELLTDRTNPLFIQVFMNNGNRVLSSIPTFAEKIPYYPKMVAAVSGQKGIFDMEVGVYFTPFADENITDEQPEMDESNREALEEFNG